MIMTDEEIRNLRLEHTKDIIRTMRDNNLRLEKRISVLEKELEGKSSVSELVRFNLELLEENAKLREFIRMMNKRF